MISAPSSNARDKPPLYPSTTRRILLADDDPILREIAEEYLSQAGYEVVLVEDGALALKAARLTRFDLIITDMFMPNLDGIELLQALKGACPGTPVIAISAGISGMDAGLLLRAATAVGAVAVVRKPLIRQVFLDEIERALQSR